MGSVGEQSTDKDLDITEQKRTSKLKQVIRLQKNGNQGMGILQPVWCRVISLTGRVQKN